jgi:uncharacterized RDD family membrane protein YckC
MSDPQEPAPSAVSAPPPAQTSWVAPEVVQGPGPGIEFGGPGARLGGYIVDVLIILAAFFALAIVSTFLFVISPILGVIGWIVSFLALLAYFPYFWAKSGQTPGMKVVKIKVVSDKDGGPITMGQAILRLIGFWVSSLVFYLGYIWIFIDKRQRGWFDLIAGTVVIKA